MTPRGSAAPGGRRRPPGLRCRSRLSRPRSLAASGRAPISTLVAPRSILAASAEEPAPFEPVAWAQRGPPVVPRPRVEGSSPSLSPPPVEALPRRARRRGALRGLARARAGGAAPAEPWLAEPELPPAPELPAPVVVHPPVPAAELPPLRKPGRRRPFWKKELSFVAQAEGRKGPQASESRAHAQAQVGHAVLEEGARRQEEAAGLG